MSADAELDAYLCVMVASAETLLDLFTRQGLQGDDTREALGWLASMASSVRIGDHEQAAAALAGIRAVLRRVRARVNAAEREARDAAMVEAGWTPPGER